MNKYYLENEKYAQNMLKKYYFKNNLKNKE